MVGEEWHWVYLNSKSSDILLLEFSSQVTLYKGSLADATISDENELEFWNLLLLLLLNHLQSED